MTLKVERVSASVDDWAGAAGLWMERHWAGALTIAFAGIAGVAALAPLLAAWGWEGPATFIYRVYGLACHQRPERSFWLVGQQMALCARDVGLLAGAALGGGAHVLWKRVRLPGRWAVFFVLPLAIDGTTQWLGWRESTNMLRVVTGLMAGLAGTLYLLPKVAEIQIKKG